MTWIEGSEKQAPRGTIFREEKDRIARFVQSRRGRVSTAEQYPIPLRVPTTVPREITYNIQQTKYRSSVKETGLKVTVNGTDYTDCVRVLIEEVGGRLRGMMPWLGDKKL